jgi:hypothetical protein
MNEDEKRIDWKVTKEQNYISFVNAKNMPLERAKVEAMQTIAEILLEGNRLVDHQNKLIEDQNMYLLGLNEKLKELEFIREAMK